MKKNLPSIFCTIVLLTGCVRRLQLPIFRSTGNPLVKDRFTTDPAPLAYGGTLYLYVGHDEFYEGQDTAHSDKKLDIIEWLCCSIQGIQTWADHGVILRSIDFKWGTGEVWASQVVERNGKFYYYTIVQADEPCNSKAIDIAVGDTPTGPFADATDQPPVTDDMTSSGPHGWWNDIDSTALTNNNGQTWSCWGNGTCFLTKLKPNLTETDGDIQVVSLPHYVESPWSRRYGNLHYLTYTLLEQRRKTMSYATAPGVEGPQTPQGELADMTESDLTIHPGVAEFQGKWYLFYHNATLALGGRTGAIRWHSVCVDKLRCGSDGTVQTVIRTKQGVAE